MTGKSATPEMRAGAALAAFLCLAALAAPLLTGYDPRGIDLSSVLQAPSSRHPLGTDHLGRDLLARLLYGTRVTIPLSLLIVAVNAAVGLATGLVSGYAGGIADEFVMRTTDIMLSFPRMIITMALAGIMGNGLGSLVLAMTATGWMYFARVVRSSVLALKNETFVMSLKSAGCPDSRILLRHVIPNVAPPVLVLCALELGNVVLSISALGFLGLGLPSSLPEWGVMLNEGRPYIEQRPLLMIFPGVMIFLTVAAVNLAGEGLRDLLDPRRAKRVEA